MHERNWSSKSVYGNSKKFVLHGKYTVVEMFVL